jgi:predicted ester cyclase
MSVMNKATVRRLYEEAFGQGKTEVVDEVLDPNFVCWDPNAEGGEIRGLETMKGEIDYFRQAFPEDFFWRVEDQLAEEDKVTTRYTLGGTHQGEFFGIPATGKRGEISGINIDRCEGGKVVEEWASYDLLGGMRQLGAIPEPGQEEEARAASEEEGEEEKGLIDKAKDKLMGQ